MKIKKTEELVKENRKRLKKLFSPYEPILGLGSPIKRFSIFIDKNHRQKYFFPEEMKDEGFKKIIKYGSVEEFFIGAGMEWNTDIKEKWFETILKRRIKCDFEFWCALCVQLWDKLNKVFVQFILRKPQRKLLKIMEEMRLSGVPIRIILLKARQWGGSTLIQLYMAWIQLFHKLNWHSAICADVESQAKHVRGMYNRMAQRHPKEIMDIELTPYEGDAKIRIFKGRGNIVGIGSMQKPEGLRTFDFAMTHWTEVASWKKTEGRSPEDLAQALRATIARVPYSLVALESTAKGIGNFFHDEWLNAVNKSSGYTAVFVPWFEIEIYQEKITNYANFIKQMTKYDWLLWELGATLDGINWYKNFKKAENYSDWRMMEEFPSTADEAFQSTGYRVFRPEYVLMARKNNRDPEAVGELFGDAQKGPEALKHLKFSKTADGGLKIWSFPDTKVNMTNRYVFFVDIGGRTKDADYSVIKGMDRSWILDGGVPEVCASWRGHLDQDLVAWKAAQICKWYNDAYLGIESNSLEKERTEGDHFLTILDEIVDYYENLYTRTNPEDIKKGVPAKYGFHTNLKTKVLLINTLNAKLRDEGYIETDKMACDEMDTYEVRPDGTYGAQGKCKDDIVIVSAGMNWLSDQMDIPVIIEAIIKRRYKKGGAMAKF